MSSIREELESAVGGRSSILILGESGSGKTLLAQAIADAHVARDALAKHGNNATAAAQELGIPASTLRSFPQSQRTNRS